MGQIQGVGRAERHPEARGNSLFCLLHLWVAAGALSCGYITLVSASVITQPSPLVLQEISISLSFIKDTCDCIQGPPDNLG